MRLLPMHPPRLALACSQDTCSSVQPGVSAGVPSSCHPHSDKVGAAALFAKRRAQAQGCACRMPLDPILFSTFAVSLCIMYIGNR